MTLKIERASDTQIVVLRLIGRVESEHVDELRGHIPAGAQQAKVVLDLDEVTLRDVSVVRFLIGCEVDGVHLFNCPLHVREWMDREQRGGEP